MYLLRLGNSKFRLFGLTNFRFSILILQFHVTFSKIDFERNSQFEPIVVDTFCNLKDLKNVVFFMPCTSTCRTTRGFMHMKIQERCGQGYILGQFSKPFRTIAQMLLYYSRNSLPVKGAEHISLKKPVCEQLL